MVYILLYHLIFFLIILAKRGVPKRVQTDLGSLCKSREIVTFLDSLLCESREFITFLNKMRFYKSNDLYIFFLW